MRNCRKRKSQTEATESRFDRQPALQNQFSNQQRGFSPRNLRAPEVAIARHHYGGSGRHQRAALKATRDAARKGSRRAGNVSRNCGDSAKNKRNGHKGDGVAVTPKIICEQTRSRESPENGSAGRQNERFARENRAS